MVYLLPATQDLHWRTVKAGQELQKCFLHSTNLNFKCKVIVQNKWFPGTQNISCSEVDLPICPAVQLLNMRYFLVSTVKIGLNCNLSIIWCYLFLEEADFISIKRSILTANFTSYFLSAPQYHFMMQWWPRSPWKHKCKNICLIFM